MAIQSGQYRAEDGESLNIGGLSVVRNSRIAVLILAAGLSRRMGKKNKLLALVDDLPMVRIVALSAVASNASQIVVVSGHESKKIHGVLSDIDLHIVENTSYESGLASSLSVGISSLDKDVDGVLVLLGDMPFINSFHINVLINTFNASDEKSVVIPVYSGKRGNPVLWPREYFQEIAMQQGDRGASRLFKKYQDNIVEVSMSDKSILVDIDTVDELQLINEM